MKRSIVDKSVLHEKGRKSRQYERYVLEAKFDHLLEYYVNMQTWCNMVIVYHGYLVVIEIQVLHMLHIHVGISVNGNVEQRNGQSRDLHK